MELNKSTLNIANKTKKEEVTEVKSGWVSHLNLLISLLILVVMLTLKFGLHYIPSQLYDGGIHGIALLLAGWPVIKLAFRKAVRRDIFNEFVLMTVATIGAFYIGSYSEGVAVMVFYCIGEWFQDSAVDNAKKNIKELLDIRPDKVTVKRDGKDIEMNPNEVKIDEIIIVKPGEKVALDGNLLTDSASFNTAALTGESKPDTKYKGEQVFAGMINLNLLVEIKVTSVFSNSKLSKILEMVQDATSRKSQTQLFISRFAKVYTPIVFFLALAVCIVPVFFVDHYIFNVWFYRSLVFLVISCPCALVVSIPLGYFGGIGLASRNGILFKGGNFLDVMTKINAVVMDKTGTLTKGVFKVQRIVTENIDKNELLGYAAALEKNTTHPVGVAIRDYAGNENESSVERIEEIPGRGIKGFINNHDIILGNTKLFNQYKITYPKEIDSFLETIIIIGIDQKYAGYIAISDEIKEDALDAIKELKKLGIKTVMLSGDKKSVVDSVALTIGVDEAYGDLLPEGKVEKLQLLKNENRIVAFIGDGINDAPVVALADVGIAMGGLGSDATIETADVIIQNDQPLKIVSAIKIGKLTRTVVWQNITMAMVIKLIVLILGAGGIATLWEAVIADVGVALLAILNAVRIQHNTIK